MDFLLECIGFPPKFDREVLIERVLNEGEGTPWRGPWEDHRMLALGGGLELRLEREAEFREWTLWPYYKVERRLRVTVDEIRKIPDSPFDVLLTGWAAPPIRATVGTGSGRPGAYKLSTYLNDARRLPRGPHVPKVLAVSIAGFALDVNYLGPNVGVFDPLVLERESGASIEPLGGDEDPGGCAEVSLRIKTIRRLENPITGIEIDILTVDAPERPLELFVSRWQLEKDGLPPPRPGYRIEGTFLFSGRIAGGLAKKRRSPFG